MTDGVQVFEGEGIDPPDEFTRALGMLTPDQIQRLTMIAAMANPEISKQWTLTSFDLIDFPEAIRKRFLRDSDTSTPT